MFIGCMINNKIHNDFDISFFRFDNQFIDIFHTSKIRMNLIIISNIIAEIEG